jgi:hypothetical protein
MALTTSYRNVSGQGQQAGRFRVYLSTLKLNPRKAVRSLPLPVNANVEVLAATLVPANRSGSSNRQASSGTARRQQLQAAVHANHQARPVVHPHQGRPFRPKCLARPETQPAPGLIPPRRGPAPGGRGWWDGQECSPASSSRRSRKHSHARALTIDDGTWPFTGRVERVGDDTLPSRWSGRRMHRTRSSPGRRRRRSNSRASTE